MRVVPRIAEDLAVVNTLPPSTAVERLTSIAVTKNKMFVIGEPGQ